MPSSVKSTRAVLLCAVLASPAIPFGPAFAADGEVAASYDITLGGFALAKGNLAVKVEKDAYTARVGYRTAGVGKVMSGARGEAKSTGTLRPDRPVPASYLLEGSGDKKEHHVTMALAAGSVRDLDVEPPLKDDDERIPVTAAHRRDVLDPLSAILVPIARRDGAAGREVCERTLPIYDGWTRYDVKLSYKRTDAVAKPGYSGPAVVCAARWIPVSGHKPDRAGTRFMAENRNLEMALAPVGDSGLMVPVRIAVETMSGLLVVQADRFQVIAGSHAAR